MTSSAFVEVEDRRSALARQKQPLQQSPLSECTNSGDLRSTITMGVGSDTSGNAPFKERSYLRGGHSADVFTSTHTVLQTIDLPSGIHLESRMGGKRESLAVKTITPKGLENVGNTCYANSALQCLLNSALANALLDPTAIVTFRRFSSGVEILQKGSGSFDDDDDTDSEVPLPRKEQRRRRKEERQLQEASRWLTKELTQIAKDYTHDRRKKGSSESLSSSASPWSFLLSSSAPNLAVVNPGSITRHPDKLSSCLRPYQQEDAHEFLRALLSTLTMNGHNTQLSSLFDGLLESAVTCQICRHTSLTRDRYMDLSLDISQDTTKTLEDALSEFTRKEILDGDNMVVCDKCGIKRPVTKGLRLATAPSILLCHLKRFAFDRYGRLVRLHKRIGFPLRLEIGDTMSKVNKAKPPPYELLGVLVHEGSSCDSGHYLSYVKSGSEWYKTNDSVVTKVDVETVLSQQAYILLYEVAEMRYNRSGRKLNKESSIRSDLGRRTESPTSVMEHTVIEDTSESSSLLSLICNAAAINETMITELCCHGGAAKLGDEGSTRKLPVRVDVDDEETCHREEHPSERSGEQSLDVDALEARDGQDETSALGATDEESNSNMGSSRSVVGELEPTPSTRRLRKSQSGGNLKKLETEASRGYRQSLSPSGREKDSERRRTYSFSGRHSDPGGKSVQGFDVLRALEDGSSTTPPRGRSKSVRQKRGGLLSATRHKRGHSSSSSLLPPRHDRKRTLSESPPGNSSVREHTIR